MFVVKSVRYKIMILAKCLTLHCKLSLYSFKSSYIHFAKKKKKENLWMMDRKIKLYYDWLNLQERDYEVVSAYYCRHSDVQVNWR